MKTLLLVDCHNILYRSFFAISEFFSTKDDMPTNALYGFIQTIFRIVQLTNPTHIIFCLDSKEKTVRTEVLETYKANRPVMPDKMILQMNEMIDTVLPAMQIPYYAKPGVEADDIIATFTAKCKHEIDQILILSSDRDLWQLLEEDKTRIISPAQSKREVDFFTKADLLSKVGISPDQVVDYKSIIGDPSDNIQGIPGVGPKTAQKWLAQYHSLDHILASDPSPSPKIREYEAILRRNQTLIKLDVEVPIEIKTMEEYAFHGWDWNRLEPVLRRYQFQSLLRRYLPSKKAYLDSGVQSFPLFSTEPNKTPFLFCWLEEPQLYICNGQEIQTHDMSTWTEDSLFSAPSWMGELKRQWFSPEAVSLFFDLKTIAHRLCLTSEELRTMQVDDIMIMWYLQDPNRKGYTFQDWLLVQTNQDHPGVSEVIHAVEKTRQGLKEHQLEKVYRTLEIPLIPCLFEMENQGVHLSKQKLFAAKKTLYWQQKSIEKAIYQQTGEVFNLQSSKQLALILYDKIHLPPLKKTKTGFSTDAETLERLAPLHPVVALVLQYREVTKILNTYLEPMEKWLDANQLIHTNYIQAGPSTGRLTSIHPNLQALPVQSETGTSVRSLFEVRKKENIFISADYSQIDLRVLAHLSQDPVMSAVFVQQGDIHDSTARSLFHLSPKETPTPAMRKLAKTVQFGIIYGMSPYGLSQALSMTDGEAVDYIQAYFSVYKGVQSFIQQTIREATIKTYAETISGRKRPIPELSSSRKNVRQLGERLAVNTTVQGSSADILKSAMIHLSQALWGTASSMIFTIHDEIILEVPKDECDQVSVLVKDKMEKAWSLSVPLVIHLATGFDLGHMK
ncbi:DNA polymerase I [bacterium]|nr:DNA polymerase I [bacterium]